MFDTDSFLNQTTEDANETKYEPTPEGEYTATISAVKARTIGEDERPVLDVTWEIDGEEDLKAKLGRDRLTVRQTVFLDVENGKLASGPNRNVQLGKLREALGQNKAGKPWSPAMLEGAGPALVLVTHRADKTDPSVIYDQVSKVTSS